MFKLEEFNPEAEAKTLKLNDRLFHEALKEELESKTRFHVKNDKGEDFDIVYWDNNDDIEPIEAYPKYVKPPYMTTFITTRQTKTRCTLTFLRGLTPAYLRS